MKRQGQLTATLAHDFNNQLAIIMGTLDLLEFQLGADADALKRINVAQNASARCAGLAKRLMALTDDERRAPHSIRL